jgi:hypothetical protein
MKLGGIEHESNIYISMTCVVLSCSWLLVSSDKNAEVFGSRAVKRLNNKSITISGYISRVELELTA